MGTYSFPLLVHSAPGKKFYVYRRMYTQRFNCFHYFDFLVLFQYETRGRDSDRVYFNLKFTGGVGFQKARSIKTVPDSVVRAHFLERSSFAVNLHGGRDEGTNPIHEGLPLYIQSSANFGAWVLLAPKGLSPPTAILTRYSWGIS